MLCASVLVVNAQTTAIPPKHNLGIGPVVGYNVENKGPVFGLNMMYEYRPFQQFGFTAALGFDQTRVDVSDRVYSIEGYPGLMGDTWIENEYSASLGARYYMGGFYVSGALGVGYMDAETTTTEDDVVFPNGSAYMLYKNISAGYQVKLKNRDVIEAEAGYWGTRSMKLGITARYKFRW